MFSLFRSGPALLNSAPWVPKRLGLAALPGVCGDGVGVQSAMPGSVLVRDGRCASGGVDMDGFGTAAVADVMRKGLVGVSLRALLVLVMSLAVPLVVSLVVSLVMSPSVMAAARTTAASSQAELAASEVVRPADPRRIPGLMDAAVAAWLRADDAALLPLASELMAMVGKLDPAARQFVFYWQARGLLRRGAPEDLLAVNDLLGRMTAGDPLTVLAYAGLVLAADEQHMKTDLLAFMVQRMSDSLAVNALPELAPLADSLRLLVIRRLVEADQAAAARQWLEGLDKRSGPYAAALVEMAMYPLRTPASWLSVNWPASSRTLMWSPVLRDVRLLLVDSLRRLGADAVIQAERKAWVESVREHLLAVRAWQSPRLLAETTLLWRGRLLIPDGHEPDQAFQRFVGCEGASAVLRCSPLSLQYLFPVFTTRSVRDALAAFNDIAQASEDLAVTRQELAGLTRDQAASLFDADGGYELLGGDDRQDFSVGLDRGERQYPLSELQQLSQAMSEHVEILDVQQRDILVAQILLGLAEHRQHLGAFGRQIRTQARMGVWRMP